MAMRLTTETASFAHPFTLSGYSDELPSGDYDVVTEEERLEGLSVLAYRRTGLYLTVQGRGAAAGQVERRPILSSDLRDARLTPKPRPPERVQVTLRDGIWHVTCDGAFYGDYHTQDYARAAAALLKMSLE